MKMNNYRRQQRKVAMNIGIVVALIWLILVLLMGRYAWIQLVEGNKLAARIRSETGEQREIHSPRGAIVDRNGRELAVSLMMKSLFIDPNSVQDADEVAARLAPIISVPEEEILADIAQGGGFVWVKHYLSLDEVKAVRDLIRDADYNCLGFQDEAKRFYPNDMLAANVLGFVGTDDVGLDGIEQAYDKLIKGGRTESFVQTDMHDNPIFNSIFSRQHYEGDRCKTIELTLDGNIQFIVEQALDAAMAANGPKSVTAIVMNPKTGDILAMASRPSYNPNQFDSYQPETWKNKAVSFIYEPGSTFKSVVAAAALQEKTVTPNQVFVDPGTVMVSGRAIQNWNGESFGTVTFTDVVKHSLNTGFAQVGLDLGAEQLIRYAKLFGFGETTGVELPAEEAGILFNPSEMRDSDIATMAIGQSIAVTPLQLVTAMSAIANDGVLLHPHIVKTIRNADGSVYEETQPAIVRRTIESATDKTLIGLLEQVVATGGGQKAAVRGYRIAGKTGTAQKIRENGVGYMEGRYIASFCGFAPVEDPQITVYVMIDDPSGIYYGGQIAAPVASDIFSQLFRYLQIEPSSDPFAGMKESQEVQLGASAKPATGGKVVVPDAVGLDASEAAMRMESAGLKMQPEGRGTAVSQSIDPNTIVEAGTAITVQFAPE